MDRNDTRHLLAELEFDGPSAAEVAAHKAERFAGQIPTKKSQRERDKEAAARKAKEEEEAAAKAYVHPLPPESEPAWFPAAAPDSHHDG